MTRAVLDTSSLFRPGLRRDLQQAAQLGQFVGIWSPWIIAELNRVLTWDWVRRRGTARESERECGRQAKAMMNVLLATFEFVSPVPPYPSAWVGLSDTWDHPIWAAAVTGQANVVVSENTRGYPPADGIGHHAHEGVRYISGRDFLSLLNSGSATPTS